MGAFNTVKVEMNCMHCGHYVPLVVQFKYGNTWQFEYAIGEELRWGGNDYGEPGAKCVVVDGAAESCPNCGLDGDYEVYVINGRIDSVRAPARLYDFAKLGKTYIVIS